MLRSMVYEAYSIVRKNNQNITATRAWQYVNILVKAKTFHKAFPSIFKINKNVNLNQRNEKGE